MNCSIGLAKQASKTLSQRERPDVKDRPLKRYIIEDDYDSEFRMRGRPIPPLFMQDTQGSVIYMNTFTRSLGSVFRIAVYGVAATAALCFQRTLYGTCLHGRCARTA